MGEEATKGRHTFFRTSHFTLYKWPFLLSVAFRDVLENVTFETETWLKLRDRDFKNPEIRDRARLEIRDRKRDSKLEIRDRDSILEIRDRQFKICGFFRHFWKKCCHQWRLWHSGSAWVVDYALYCRTWVAYFVHLCHNPLHWLRFLTRTICTEPCQCSCIVVPCLAFRVYFAGELNKKISFVVGVLSNKFACALLGVIRQGASCPLQLSIF